MDDDLSELIKETVALHILDISTISSNSTALIRLPSPNSNLVGPDSEFLAFRLYAQELQQATISIRDHRMAESLDEASRLDEALINTSEELERIAREDRILAQGLSRGIPLPQLLAPESIKEILCPSTFLEIEDALPGKTEKGKASADSKNRYQTSASATLSSVPTQYFECVICGDRKPSYQLIPVHCSHSHRYCIDCLRSLFVAATNDESLNPPKCDGTIINLSLILPYLTTRQTLEFKAKSIEFSTTRRLYCFSPSCSTFLGSLAEGEVVPVQCYKCFKRSCKACGSAWHGLFTPCKDGNDAEAVEVLRNDFNYQRCPGCRRMVELQVGCYHMTCLCRKEFCYLCAATWKTCQCTQWSEARLLVAAEERVAAREEDGPAVPVQIHARRVQRAVEELIDNHECAHQYWSLRHGAAQCQVCNHTLARYLLRCSNCMMLACVRCRRNRL